jgi:hypothetical protein
MEVVKELSAGATPSVVRDFLAHRPDWLHIRDPTPEMVAAVNAELDPGERAALALACELRADLVLMDDAAGRREASSLHLRMTGTLGVLRLAAERRMIDVPAVVTAIRESGFYLDESLRRATFGKWML